MTHTDEIKSINAVDPIETVSDKYSFIPTTRAIGAFYRAGWRVSDAQEINVRKAEREGKQKHLIRFRNPSLKQYNDDLIPEVVLSNAHDGTASFSVMMGFFRIVCSNGLIVSDGMFQQMKIKHVGYTDAKVRDAIDHVIDSVPKITAQIKDLEQIQLDPFALQSFACDALAIRYNLDRSEYDDTDILQRFFLREVLTARRREDTYSDIWHVYNRVQENIIKGTNFLRNNKKNARQNYRKAKPVTSVNENIRINRQLWQLAMTYAEAA